MRGQGRTNSSFESVSPKEVAIQCLVWPDVEPEVVDPYSTAFHPRIYRMWHHFTDPFWKLLEPESDSIGDPETYDKESYQFLESPMVIRTQLGCI